MQQQDGTHQSASAAAGGGPSDGSGDGSSSGASTSLFNADEARFMNDSFSSAESFDPFRDGAPGFKVPNVLPAHLGGIGAAPGSVRQAGQDSTMAGMDASSIFPQQQGSFFPNAQQSANGNDAKMGGGGGGGAYGQNKVWQLQQLQALQAERFKYMAMQQALPLQQRQHIQQKQIDQEQHRRQQLLQQRQAAAGQPDASYNILMNGGVSMPVSLPDTSQIGHTLRNDPTWHMQLQQHGIQSLQNAPSSSSQIPYPGNGGSGAELSSLGAHFPSSHQFPNPGLGGHATAAQIPVGYSSNSMDQSRADGDETSYDAHRSQSLGVGSQRSDGSSKKGKGRASKALGQQEESTVKASPEPDAPYTFEAAPRPPMPTVDLEKLSLANIVPKQLQSAFFSPDLKRMQPHLRILRAEQLRRKEQGLSANIRKDRRDAKASARGAADDDEDASEEGASGKKKQVHALLTEAEKKANHIASEQKRRANIRKGYEQLCALVPSLREEMGGDGETSMNGGGGGNEEGQDSDEEGDEDEDDEEGSAAADGSGKRGKKRRAVDGGGGGGTTGDKLDGKSGPRSEATILLKAVEHIRSQVGQHYALVTRKQELQRQLAQKLGADASCILTPPSK